MRNYLMSKANQQLSYWSIRQLKEASNMNGMIFAVVNEVGQIVDSRKTNGSAHRALEKRYLLKDDRYATSKLYVIPLNVKRLIQDKQKDHC